MKTLKIFFAVIVITLAFNIKMHAQCVALVKICNNSNCNVTATFKTHCGEVITPQPFSLPPGQCFNAIPDQCPGYCFVCVTFNGITVTSNMPNIPTTVPAGGGCGPLTLEWDPATLTFKIY